ncbi:hypothetical protein F2P81_025846 [Scophthalmus maximus]|uniref:Uncharacterized protein n=1 Tax=Scophthalmus maximus TaxID=52904 RepID=A0A6A4RRP9_SCOMX|nr:hypothetical protein F2P81_025846 [Scophthalmus maximus]
MPFDCGSEEPHLGHVNGGYLFLRAGSLRVTRSSVVMLSTVDGALGGGFQRASLPDKKREPLRPVPMISCHKKNKSKSDICLQKLTHV